MNAVPFPITATTEKQRYPRTPGEYYNYNVRAVAASNASEFSNVAVVYGSI
jgi:hypothetical protein